MTSGCTLWHYPKEGTTQSREVVRLPGSCGIVPWCLSLYWLTSIEPFTKPIGGEDEKLLTFIRRISQQSFCEDLELVLPVHLVQWQGSSMSQTTNHNLSRRPEVAAFVGVHPNTISNLVAAGLFPKPIRLSRRLHVWDMTEVSRFMEQQREGV